MWYRDTRERDIKSECKQFTPNKILNGILAIKWVMSYYPGYCAHVNMLIVPNYLNIQNHNDTWTSAPLKRVHRFRDIVS